jgi:hypothetical protein
VFFTQFFGGVGVGIGSVSGLTVVTSALSITFNLKGKQTKLMNDIQKLHKIKEKLKYVVSCNGNIYMRKNAIIF